MKHVLFAAILTTLAGCAAWWAGSTVGLFSGDLIKVPHARHKAGSVDCLACHEEIYDAKELGKSYRPPEAKCMECHADEKAKGNCGMCHTDVKHARPYPERAVTMNLDHAAHINRVKEDCTVCHRQLPDPVRSPSMRPTMAACLTCHQKQYDDGKCDQCHRDLSHYTLKPVSSFRHVPDFIRSHGRDARSSIDTCANCHEQTFCTDCHASTVATRIEIKQTERVERDFIHRNDYQSRHSIEARGDSAACRRCHGTSFCESCHALNNLTPTAVNPRNPHPPGWSFPGPNSHAQPARRDIASCAACHDDGPRSICINCHKVGGIGGNPHPPGWTEHHPRSEINSNGMCLYCHP
jgi:hypothetical protein